MAEQVAPLAGLVAGDSAEALRLRDAERVRRYRDYLDFYEGKHWQGQAGGQRTRLVLNYARAIVDKGASYLLGRGINFSVSRRQNAEGGQESAREAERLLYQVYEDNDLDAADLHGAINAGVLGDAVFKVFWDQAEQRIRVLNLDPFRFFARWAPDDLSTLRQVEVVYSSAIERWTTDELVLLVDGREVRRGPNPYGFIPFVQANEGQLHPAPR